MDAPLEYPRDHLACATSRCVANSSAVSLHTLVQNHPGVGFGSNDALASLHRGIESASVHALQASRRDANVICNCHDAEDGRGICEPGGRCDDALAGVRSLSGQAQGGFGPHGIRAITTQGDEGAIKSRHETVVMILVTMACSCMNANSATAPAGPTRSTTRACPGGRPCAVAFSVVGGAFQTLNAAEKASTAKDRACREHDW